MTPPPPPTPWFGGGDIFNSHDAVSLFTKIPIQGTLTIIRECLHKDQDLKKRTNLEVDDIMDLTEFIATTTYFSFRGQLFKQKFGSAMGSPVCLARSRFWTPLSPGGRTDPSNYWFTGKPHTQTSTCRFNRIIHFSTNLERSDSIVTDEEDRKQEEEYIQER